MPQGACAAFSQHAHNVAPLHPLQRPAPACCRRCKASCSTWGSPWLLIKHPIPSSPSASPPQKVQGQLFNLGLSLVRNFGIAGGTSKLLGALSAGVARLAANETT